MCKVDQRLQDVGHPLCLAEDVGGESFQFRVVGLEAKVLGETGNAGNRIANLMRDTSGKLADGRKSLIVKQLVGETLAVGDILNDDHEVRGCEVSCLVD